jgi:hypothetical protein
MEANLTPEAPTTEPPPESATTPRAPSISHEQAMEILRGAVTTERERLALQAIENWSELRHEAADLNAEADRVERAGFLNSSEKTEAGRKAAGQLAAAALRLKAEHVEIDAQAAGRLVDLLIPRAVVLR